MVAVPRLAGRLGIARPGETPDWQNTAIPLPRGGCWRDRLTGQLIAGDAAVPAAILFERFPVALLVREE